MPQHKLLGFAAAAALAGLLSLPVAAQATQTSGQAADTTQAATAPAATATNQPPLTEPVKQGFWGKLNPFARKKYVQGQLSPIRDRVNELNGLSADNAKEIADTDARAKAGIADANDRAQKASETADAAQQQVQQTATQATQLNQQVSTVNSKLQGVDQYQVAQQAELHFKPGPANLNSSTQEQLDTFLQGLDSQKGYVVEVTAYSTRKGAAGVVASQDLADAVVRYLVLQHNVPLYRIYTMGMGNAAPAAAQMSSSSASAKSTAGGTVEIKILKNSLAG
ncbi:MAG TPA: OmpA family protein [Terriglobales bacterium]|nr:OmpA family protein [Terriglobales bacterium]